MAAVRASVTNLTIAQFGSAIARRPHLTSPSRHAIHDRGLVQRRPKGRMHAMKPWAAPGVFLAAAWLALAPQPGRADPPEQPRVIEGIIEVGKPGGERMLIGRERDPLLQHLRLLAPDRLRPRPEPDARHPRESRRGLRMAGLHPYLRQGHKWSDGQPFTAEDFRLLLVQATQRTTIGSSFSGVDIQLLADGEQLKVEVLDEPPSAGPGPSPTGSSSRRWPPPNPAVHLPAGPLPQAVPQEIRRSGTAQATPGREPRP